MVMKYVKINPDMDLLNNVGPITDYLERVRDTNNLIRFIQGMNPVRNGNNDPKTLDDCVKKLQTVHESIPSSETDVKIHATIVLSVARGCYDKAKEQEEYAQQ